MDGSRRYQFERDKWNLRRTIGRAVRPFGSFWRTRRRSIVSACARCLRLKTTFGSWRRRRRLQNLYSALQRFPTDVVLLEGQLLAGTIDAIPELVRRAPEAKLIVQLSEADEANTVELYRRGVRGVVPRSISPDLLIKCVRKIADGETWIDNQSVSWVIDAYRSQATTLTNPAFAAEAFEEGAGDYQLHHAWDAQQGDCLPDRDDRAGDQELPAQGV